MESNYPLATKNGSAGWVMNLPEIFGESTADIVVTKYAGFICSDDSHPCFGKAIVIADVLIGQRNLHLEMIGDKFNVILDRWRTKENMSRQEMIDFIRRETCLP